MLVPSIKLLKGTLMIVFNFFEQSDMRVIFSTRAIFPFL